MRFFPTQRVFSTVRYKWSGSFVNVEVQYCTHTRFTKNVPTWSRHRKKKAHLHTH